MITEPPTSPDHTAIRDMVRDLVTSTFTIEKVRAAAGSPRGFDEVAWKQMVDLGWASLALRADVGGEDLGAYVQCLVHRELGARLAPSPYLSTAGFAGVALHVLADERGHDLLAAIGAGTLAAALVLGHGRGWPQGSPPLVTACETADGWAVDGRAEMVLDAGRADVLVVVASVGEHGRWALFEVDARADAVRRTAVATVDATRSVADIVFDAAPGRCLRTEPLSVDELSGLVDRVVVYLAAEMVGAAVSCLQQTLDYLRTRRQFGKPIGSFQALKHRCADAAVAVTVAQELVFSTAAMLDAGDDAGLCLSAPLLLARVGEVFKHCTEEAIQLHGGVGFTDEFDVGLYYKRALLDTELLASTADAYARMEIVRRAAVA
jgi:alkylation response protein AidB-like acyl-CoA dehydrogenase